MENKRPSYIEARDKLQERVQKQHDHRHLPRTRCVIWQNEQRLEFVLPEGETVDTFCRGEKKLNPKAHQIVYPGTKVGLVSVRVNFDSAAPWVWEYLDEKVE